MAIFEIGKRTFNYSVLHETTENNNSLFPAKDELLTPKLFNSEQGKAKMVGRLLIGFLPFIVWDTLIIALNVTAFVFTAIHDFLYVAYDTSANLLNLVINNDDETSKKARVILSNALLLLVFLGLAAKNSGISNLSLLLPFAAPIFFLALGIFEFLNTIALLKENNNGDKSKIALFSFNEFKAANACFMTLGCLTMAISGSLLTVPFLTPVMFTTAFAISFTQSLIIAIANIRDHGGASRESVWSGLNFLYNAFGLFAAGTSFLLPALGLTIAPLWIAVPLIIAAITRIIPMVKDTDQACYATVRDSVYSTLGETNDVDNNQQQLKVFNVIPIPVDGSRQKDTNSNSLGASMPSNSV